MTTCKYKDKIETRAKRYFIDIKRIGLSGKLTSVEGEYYIRVAITENSKVIGIADIYYKPAKDSYSIVPKGKMSETNKSRVEACFNRMVKGSAASTKTSKSKCSYTDKGLEIDVDGSNKNGKASYAAIIRFNGAEANRLSGEADPTSNQINGELQAVIESVNWCRLHRHKTATIFHDLKLSAELATGKKTPRTDFNKAYKKYIDSCGVKINWVKVPAHSGFKWNEQTDLLAKSFLNSL